MGDIFSLQNGENRVCKLLGMQKPYREITKAGSGVRGISFMVNIKWDNMYTTFKQDPSVTKCSENISYKIVFKISMFKNKKILSKLKVYKTWKESATSVTTVTKWYLMGKSN